MNHVLEGIEARKVDHKKLLEVKNLEIGFPNKKNKNVVVNGISFNVYEGEILGIVGESGSGKSMTALSIIDLLSKEAKVLGGSIHFCGTNLLELNSQRLRELKGNEISMIFQEPMTSLNPLMEIGEQVEEMLTLHSSLKKQERRERVLRMLEEVGLKNVEDLYDKYPHQLSGGMRQRVMIAMAMICKPKLLIADEPTTALDVTVQAQILELIKELNQEFGTTVIFISHDLGVIKGICNRAIVMSEGIIVESNDIDKIFDAPQEEYTKKLIEAVPSINKSLKKRNFNKNNKNNEKNEENNKENTEKNIQQTKYSQSDKDKDETSIGLGIEKLQNESNIENKNNRNILEVSHLNVYYEGKRKFMGKSLRNQVVKDVSFTLKKGEILGIVGESGCGKSTLSRAIVGLNKDIEGTIKRQEKRPQMVFQDPYNSLNPARKIGWILEEPLRIQGGYTKEERKQKVYEVLQKVGLNKEYANRYVRELSGGQRQRVSIASAIITNTKMVILDEPVSALDVTIQAQILDLLLHLRDEYDLSYIFISHDLNVIYEMCDRVLVMYQGAIIEEACIEELYTNPKEEYTKVLLKAIPQI